jgi:hypothetical protein
LAECRDGCVVALSRPEAQGHLHKGFPGVLRVSDRLSELVERLVEHVGLFEHTTALIVVECRRRLFHV